MRKYPRYRLIINIDKCTLKLFRELDEITVELIEEAKLGKYPEFEKLHKIVRMVNEELAK